MNFPSTSPCEERSQRALRAPVGFAIVASALLAASSSCSSNNNNENTDPPVPNTSTAFTSSLNRAQTVNNATLGAAVRVTVRNEAPTFGTFHMPVWLGLHDGTFDLFDDGAPASAGLEDLAEDGDITGIAADFAGATGTSQATEILGTFGPMAGQIAPNEVQSVTMRVDPTAPESRYLGWISMVIPSNDAFVGSQNPLGHELFDATGTFVGTSFTVGGNAVRDAGTEVNDEVPANTAFFGQTVADSGTAENGMVGNHPGYIVGGAILSDPMFVNADFENVMGYSVLDFVVEDVTSSVAEPAGSAVVSLNPANDMMTFDISVANLSGPATAVHLHRGATGIAGGVEIDLMTFVVVNTGGTLVVTGSEVISASQVQAMRNGNMYFNVHTAMNPSGEIRGQISANNASTASLTAGANVAAPMLGEAVTFTVQNAAPALGTYQAPIWLGFHDGSFDMFDIGVVADPDLEVLAEDGDTSALGTTLEMQVVGSTDTTLTGAAGPVAPGETVTYSRRFDVDGAANQYFSWASMILPSNDGFVGNADPLGHPLFAGSALSATDFVVAAADALDAGTEANDELEVNVPFFGAATMAGAGTMTAVNIAGHAGYLPGGAILMDPMFTGADFANVAGYEFMRVAVSSSTPVIAASGAAWIRFSGTTATVTARADNLSGAATTLELREAAVGADGPVVQDLTSDIDVNADGTLQISATFTADQTFRDALAAGTIYFQVATDLNPLGELRGQVADPVANL